MMNAAALMLSMVVAPTTPVENAGRERPDFRAELGGIASFLVLVDVPDAPGSAFSVAKEAVQERVTKVLSEANRRVISRSEALKSMKGVAVVRVGIDVVAVGDSRHLALYVESEVRRRALVDCCAYAPLAMVWRTRDLMVMEESRATGELNRIIDKQVRSIVSAIRSVPETPPAQCDDCRLLDGK
jgi:hypothetical protein